MQSLMMQLMIWNGIKEIILKFLGNNEDINYKQIMRNISDLKKCVAT